MKRSWIIGALFVGACTGSTGPQGPQGPDGPQGSAGPQGPAGSDGANGSNGNDIIISDTAKHGLDISPVAIDTTGMTATQIEAIGQGSYLVNAVGGCADCHGEAGSTPGFLAGTATQGAFNARNLTPDGTTGLQLTEAQFVDVLRTGTNYICTSGTCTADTHTLKVMPWPDFRWAATDDLKAIYAYLRAIPPVTNQVPADTGTLGGAPVAFGTQYTDGAVTRDLPAEADAMMNPVPDPDWVRRGMAIQPLAAVTSADATTEARIGRGSYLVNSIGGCNGCHTNPARVNGKINVAAYLTGGHVFNFGATVGAFTGSVRSMTADLIGQNKGFFATGDFLAFEGLLQTGIHVDDLDMPPVAAPMPWQKFRNMTVEDLEAVYTYLDTVWNIQPSQLTTDKVTADASYYCAADADCDALNGGVTGIETCDLTTTSATYHECIGRTCQTDSDCRACQTCDLATQSCGGTVVATCVSSGI